MSYKPPYVVLDFETSGLEYYRDDFTVVSCAIAYLNEKSEKVSKYYDKPAQIRNVLKKLSESDVTLVVFNATFELGVLKCVYPEIKFKEIHDVMRLAQQHEGGGGTKEFGLKASVRRNLPEYAGYEKKIHEWILANIPEAKKSDSGAYLSQAPTELLEEYNKKDVEATLDLYRLFTAKFAQQKFDWRIDHALYMSSAHIVAEAKIKGVRVNREKLKKYSAEIDKEIEKIDKAFFTENAEAIAEVRELLKAKEQAKFKKKIVTELPEFNLGSKQHLEFLFQNVKKQEAKLKTKKGKPSFKAAHMSQWEGSDLLVNRGKRLLVKVQVENLLIKSSYDSRWHVDLNLCATTTGRCSGGGGLNVQAMPRRDRGIMECIEADTGCVVVSSDISSLEPSITSHYSKDERYSYACVTGIGKAPFYKNNVLFIDDIYLSYLSVAPFGSIEMKNTFDSGVFEDGRNFVEQWLHNPDYIKNLLKNKRAISKTCVLGLSYGLGPKNLQKQLFEKGLDFDLKTCKEAFDNYWKLFSDVKRFGKIKEYEFERNGYVVTGLGFRVIPDAGYKAFNNFIQGTSAGVIHCFCEYIVKYAPYAQIQVTIHDEAVIQVSEDRVEDLRLAVKQATECLNNDLNWDIPIRSGFVVGKTWYEAK